MNQSWTEEQKRKILAVYLQSHANKLGRSVYCPLDGVQLQIIDRSTLDDPDGVILRCNTCGNKLMYDSRIGEIK